MKKRVFLWALFAGVLFLCVTFAQAVEQRLVIKGKVIDGNSMTPVPAAFVEIENASGGSGYSRAHTDQNGEFTFKDLPTGVSFNLYAEKKGYTSYRRLYWGVDRHKEMESIVVKLSKEAVLQCRITASDKVTPITRARVTMKPMGWRRDRNAVYEFERESGDNGLVKIDKIPSGAYELIIEKSGYIRERLTNIKFLTGKMKEMDVALYRPASISGRVRLHDKKIDLSGIPVIARGPSARTSTSNFRGVYALRDLKPGTYGFTANKPGFKPYTFTGVVTIKEGEEIRDIDHFLEAEPEKIRIAIYQEVYPLKKEIKFTVRAFRSEDFTIEFYRIPVRWYLKNSHAFKGLLKGDSSLERFDRVHTAQHGFKRFRPYTWFTKEVKIQEEFSPGIYLVRATTSHAEDRNFIFVSNLGVVLKRGKNSLLAYTVNFENNQPEGGVDLFVLKGRPEKKDTKKNLFQQILGLFRNDKILIKGKTNEKGVFETTQGIPGSDLLVVGIKANHGIGISESYLSHAARSEGAKYYTYTDRPVYRPGHRVFFKGILRVDDGTTLRVKRQHEAEIQVKDPKGRVVQTLKRTSDEMGTLNGHFDLSPDTPLGQYTLWTRKGQISSQVAYFFVEAYRKPDFKVEVKTDKKAYATDETIRCSIQAAYFFGSPLENVSVTYHVYQKMTRKPFYRYWWEGEYYRKEGYQSLINSGTGKTDAQGFFSMEVIPPPKSYDRMITIVAEVTAPSGRKFSGRQTVVYNQSLYHIVIHRQQFIHKMDQPLKFHIQVEDIEGNPVKTRFSASLEQEVWNPIRSRYEKPMTPLYTEEFHTDERGKAILEIPLSELKAGYTRLMVSAVDPRGTKATQSTSLWLYDSLYGDFNYNYAGLEIWLDRVNYKVGDTARLLINTPVKNGVILFTMEGQEILKHEVINMTSKTKILEIPVEKTFAPNLFLSVIQHDENRLYHKKVSLDVVVEGQEMAIEARFDKKEYRPKDTALLTIRAADQQGNPVKADFSVGVVDEAIYYVRQDHTTPIRDFFYAKRSPWVSTTYSFPIRYLGGAVKDAGARVVRKDFRDTAFWLPNLSTDEEGKASVRIPFPDNLTTWVTTIRGHSVTNLFGEKKAKSLVTKPLVTSLKLPRFFIREDQTEVRVLNYNRTENPLEQVRNTLSVEPPISLVGSAVQTIQIPKGGTGQLAWSLDVGKGRGKTSITIRTEAERLFDGEQRTVPVLSRGLLKLYDFSGRTHAGHARIRFPLKQGHVMEMTTLEVEFTPHPVLSGLTALNYLTGFPYGCVEQTMNSFIPMASYYEALGSAGFNLGDMAALRKKIEKGVSRLEGYQRPDGSFGWWRGSEGDLYMTSLVLLGLSKIKGMGVMKVDILISKVVKYLRREITRTRLMDEMAFGLYAMSEAGLHHGVLLRTLKSNIRSMDALPLSFTTLALLNHGMAEEAGKAADRLVEEMETGPDGAFFPEPDPYGRKNSIESTAFALIALLRAYPQHPSIDEILRWLVVQKTGRYWVSTKTTGLVILALSEYLKTRKGEIPLEDQTIDLSLNGEKASGFQIKKTDYLKGKVQVVSLPSSSIIHGTNLLDIKGEHDLYYALRVKSFLESDQVTPASYRCEMPLSKKIYAVTRVHDSRGNPRILSRPFEPDDELQVGEEIRIEMRFTPDRDYEYFILEDGLPSGFEVVDFEKDSGLRWWKPYARKERRDEKVVFFFNRLHKGREVTADYILRSELNGEFHLPPARLFGMYQPFIYTHSGSKKLRVGSYPKQ